ncbi:hypothetical protein CERSUDRAFT_90112 [Gelatoporia subvermispora B]|uniref:SET domain-containing protein n=1 Tax=Ceriporiopsis subvermispora (strain B) TaxID=914234 RepID=M2PXE9_CERS8|nr:hypothetical protein CERSUDRAFT_90112 [Gelatoporia subvermispora B]
MARPLYEPSPPPEEDWGDETSVWPVKRVVDEYIDAFGVKKYEIKWDDWSRPDGTNTTWETALIGNEEVIADWKARQAERRRRLAQHDIYVPVGHIPGQLFHEARTVENSRAYEERLRESRRRNVRGLYEGWDNIKRLGSDDDDNENEHDDDDDDDYDDAELGRRQDNVSDEGQDDDGDVHMAPADSTDEDPNDLRRSSSPEDRSRPPPLDRGGPRSQFHPTVARNTLRRLPVSSSSDDSEGTAPANAYSSRPTRASRNHTPASSSTAVSRSTPTTSRPTKPLPKRAARTVLQGEWQKAALEVGAAPISIVNDVNDEEIPPLPGGFRYCERKYVRAPDVPQSAEAMNLLVMCDCDDLCMNAQICQCQDPSDLFNDFEEREFAYDTQGRFKFNVPSGVDVIECNKSCVCPRLCPNRVAQLPRDVPLEIFRTTDRGWGVRSTVSIPAGKVIGIYTGELIRRDEADIRVEHRSYIFDLDMHEGPNHDIDESQRFSVDSYAVGNWSRFLNHSCEPNLKVYPVVWDTIPEANQPYLAFAATQAVGARTEFTIDYNPDAASRYKKGKIVAGG